MPLRLAAALAAVLLLAPASATARDPTRSRHLWATVNVCDTARHPNVIGVRVSMPGTGRRGDRMLARIQIEWFDVARGAWRSVGRRGDSGTLRVGSGARRVVQSGANFAFRPPRAGSFLLRGHVRFAWQRGRRAAYQARRVTEGGHGREVRVADPRGHSRASCAIR